ncbi:hypothetical protein ACWCPI_37400 [Streptomyces sp. NPDC001920]
MAGAQERPASQRLGSPYYADARTGSKRETDWQGWKVHLTETCEPDRPNLITNVLTTSAPVHDVQVTDTIHEALAEQGLLPAEHFVDSGYTEVRLLVSARPDFDVELVGPVQNTAAWQGKGRGRLRATKRPPTPRPPTTPPRSSCRTPTPSSDRPASPPAPAPRTRASPPARAR